MNLPETLIAYAFVAGAATGGAELHQPYPVPEPEPPIVFSEPVAVEGSTVISMPGSSPMWACAVWAGPEERALASALSYAGLEKPVPAAMLRTARAFLRGRGLAAIVAMRIETIENPEEAALYVSAQFSLPLDLERVLALDLELAEILVAEHRDIPYRFSVVLAPA